MTQKMIVANWKMNGSMESAHDLALALAQKDQNHSSNFGTTVVICPPFVHLALVAQRLLNSRLQVGAQDCSAHAQGAYTGQISGEMIKELGAHHVLLGHSERRSDLGESHALIRRKAQRALESKLMPIICVGEDADARARGNVGALILEQIQACLPETESTCCIAYEPLWAIGTGKVPEISEISDIHSSLAARYPNHTLLYGGSVNARNAAEILAIPHVHGLLVGGASLKAEEFWTIVEAAEEE